VNFKWEKYKISSDWIFLKDLSFLSLLKRSPVLYTWREHWRDYSDQYVRLSFLSYSKFTEQDHSHLKNGKFLYLSAIHWHTLSNPLRLWERAPLPWVCSLDYISVRCGCLTLALRGGWRRTSSSAPPSRFRPTIFATSQDMALGCVLSGNLMTRHVGGKVSESKVSESESRLPSPPDSSDEGAMRSGTRTSQRYLLHLKFKRRTFSPLELQSNQYGSG